MARVNAPIGSDIGGRTPAEIPLSIMAEILVDRYGKNKKEDSGPMGNL
jgi:xanthine/CO dehydrogenase XdhC/CoxF family maturation factor